MCVFVCVSVFVCIFAIVYNIIHNIQGLCAVSEQCVHLRELRIEHMQVLVNELVLVNYKLTY